MIPLTLAAGVSSFSDVFPSNPNIEAINYLKASGIIDGYPDGTFKPDQVVNRAEALKMIFGIEDFNYWHRAEGAIVGGAQVDIAFSDIDQSAWYMEYLQRAVNDGIVQGYPDGTFKPAQTVNLAENVKMLLNHTYLRIDSESNIAVNGKPYADVNTDAWFAPYVQYAKDRNFLTADSDNMLNPDQGMTRGSLAQLVYRVMLMDDYETDKFVDLIVERDENLNKLVIRVNGDVAGELPGTLDDNMGEVGASVRKISGDMAYIDKCATGFGGYIMYYFCHGNTYEYNIGSGDLTDLTTLYNATDLFFMDATKNGDKIAWVNQEDHQIVVTNTDDKTDAKYDVDSKYAQYGDVMFSPDSKKVAYAAIVGNPEDESGAVFTVDLESGDEELVIESSNVYHVYGWSDNDTVIYDVSS